MVAQLMHVGRVSNHLNKPAGAETVAPSALAAAGEIYTDQQGMQPFDTPRALDTEEVANVVGQYRQATQNAFDAGFDGGLFTPGGASRIPNATDTDTSGPRSDRIGALSRSGPAILEKANHET